MAGLKPSDLKVGDVLRMRTNQGLYDVAEICPKYVVVNQHGNRNRQYVYPSTLVLFDKVDKKSGALSAPAKRSETVAEHFDITAGVMAALELLADRQNTPEEYERAAKKGYKKPYMISMYDMINGLLKEKWIMLTHKQVDQIANVRSEIDKRLSEGRDHELIQVFDAADTIEASVTKKMPAPRTKQQELSIAGEAVKYINKQTPEVPPPELEKPTTKPKRTPRFTFE